VRVDWCGGGEREKGRRSSRAREDFERPHALERESENERQTKYEPARETDR
jgi:hypothetical protein